MGKIGSGAKSQSFKSKPSHLQRFVSGNRLPFSHQAKKEERELERHRKHKALRKYSKICKAEGVVSDRVRVDGVELPGENRNENRKELVSNRRKEKPQKSKGDKLLESAKAIAARKQQEREEEEASRQKREIEIKGKEESREAERKKHMKRTKKGQPILHNQISGILDKLKKEKGII